MEIVKLGDPILRTKAKPVRSVSRTLSRLIDEMAAVMYGNRGVGLAAPQVGVSKRVIVVDVGEGLIELINPVIISAEGSQTAPEGCLSIPNLVGDVTRAETVRVSGLDRNGRKQWVDGSGMLARALQHEIDHLDGVLFVDRARNIRQLPDEDQETEESER